MWKTRSGVDGNSEGQPDFHRILLLGKAVDGEVRLWYKTGSLLAAGEDNGP